MAEKVTKMLIKVDLQCYRCYKKIKKILCEFPHIRDQVYDEKKDTVTITVVCCCPEKILQKIRCKGGDTIRSIEILPDKPKETPKEEPKKEAEKTKEKEKEAEKVGPLVQVPVSMRCYPPVLLYPIGTCCQWCYEGHCGGPCFHGHGRPWPMCPDGCGRSACECQGQYSCGYYVSRCDSYFSEENATGCTIV